MLFPGQGRVYVNLLLNVLMFRIEFYYIYVPSYFLSIDLWDQNIFDFDSFTDEDFDDLTKNFEILLINSVFCYPRLL